jgi:tetratricopeptide (TPR) repeat protein
MANSPRAPAPRGRRIPLSRFWLDWRISFFLLAVCLLVVGAGLGALWSGLSTGPPPADSSAAVYRERAQLYEGLGKVEEAITEYQAALRLTPTDPGLYRELGDLFEKQGRNEEAVALYEQAVTRVPAGAEAPALQGRLERLRGRR